MMDPGSPMPPHGMVQKLQRRGYRPQPTPRCCEHQAIATARDRFVNGADRHRERLGRGTLVLGQVTTALWRVAVLNDAGQRTVVGSAHGTGVGYGLTRTIAEALRRAPDQTGEPAGTRPNHDPRSVAHQMRMRRNARTPYERGDGTVTMTVPGAQVVIGRLGLHGTSLTGGLRLTVEGPWTTTAVAKLADAMLRDLAPQARHVTYTSPPRGHLRDANGIRFYDATSWAHCSCGWYDIAADRALARSSARWHREHPALYHPEPTTLR
jgi:hypothetical protein